MDHNERQEGWIDSDVIRRALTPCVWYGDSQESTTENRSYLRITDPATAEPNIEPNVAHW